MVLFELVFALFFEDNLKPNIINKAIIATAKATTKTIVKIFVFLSFTLSDSLIF